jgi:hypothetical protein
VRPFEEAPFKVVVIGIAAICAFVVGTVLMKQVVLGFIGFAMILGTTAEYWMGTTYRITAEEASSRTGLSYSAIAWADVLRIIEDEEGMRLSPLTSASWRDAFRGVYLKYGKEMSQVRDLVGRYGPA